MAARQKKVLFFLALALSAALLACALLFFEEFFPPQVQQTDFIMDTLVNVTVRGKDAAQTAELALGMLHKLENTELSRFREQADVYKANHAAGHRTAVSADIAHWVALGNAVEQRSNGKYSVTLGKLSDLWNVNAQNPKAPSPERIAALLKQPRNVSVEGNSLTVAPGGMLDLGSLGKGAACDRLRAFLASTDCKEAVASVGGSVLLYGAKDDFRIGIRDPKGQAEDFLGELTLGASCVSTSGSYERFFMEGGKRYHHILDGTTGSPAESELASVTVILPERPDAGVLSDILSTACFVLGYDGALPLLQEYGADAVFVFERGSIRAASYTPSGLRFQLTNTNYHLDD